MRNLILTKDNEYYTPKYVVDYFFPFGLGKQGKSPAFGSVILKLDKENTVHYINLKEGDIYDYTDTL